MKRQKGEGGFSAQFSGIFIFIIDLYYRDLNCSKSITKSFVMYSDNRDWGGGAFLPSPR